MTAPDATREAALRKRHALDANEAAEVFARLDAAVAGLIACQRDLDAAQAECARLRKALGEHTQCCGCERRPAVVCGRCAGDA